MLMFPFLRLSFSYFFMHSVYNVQQYIIRSFFFVFLSLFYDTTAVSSRLTAPRSVGCMLMFETNVKIFCLFTRFLAAGGCDSS